MIHHINPKSGVEMLYPEPIEALMTGVSGIKKLGDICCYIIYTDGASSARKCDKALSEYDSFFAAVKNIQDSPEA